MNKSISSYLIKCVLTEDFYVPENENLFKNVDNFV
jgi:hypothetical protein